MQITVPDKATKTTARLRKAKRAAFVLTYASAVCILFSIALSQICLGLALVSLFFGRQKLRWPPVLVPLSLFFAITLLAVLLSPDPASGWPQVRKFYVFAILPMVFTTFTSSAQMRSLFAAWGGIAFLSALQSAAQYVHRYHLALSQYAYDYGFFLDGRLTGFASHWMTFSGEQMIAVLMLLSLLLFGSPGKWKWLGFVGVAVIWASIFLGLTRSVFLLGLPGGAFYLLWKWKSWVALAVPVVVLLAFFCGPVQVRERVSSVMRPHQNLDSNAHRSITRRTGWQMIVHHPWFGLGPEQIAPQFLSYAPPDIPRPLPKGYYGHLHNIYLQYSAERGVPALLVFLWLISRAARHFYRGSLKQRSQPEALFVLHGAIAVIIAVLAEGFFEYNLGDSEILTLFLVVVACAYRVLESAEPPACSNTQDSSRELKWEGVNPTSELLQRA